MFVCMLVYLLAISDLFSCFTFSCMLFSRVGLGMGWDFSFVSVWRITITLLGGGARCWGGLGWVGIRWAGWINGYGTETDGTLARILEDFWTDIAGGGG
ncbi:hypothetical protein BZA05DRAFT_384065 [Tricharina praecox]|uniref:uncharacterized protein n=1 Tax=Tricharina praecox TaxID=43433 RepID=UPI00221F39A9|nr:uncharacterized protein BZA05DRAFT_384065 [Tricharina praecox]KAI5857594.1 hypothetical protein BZA05DRAFT_384065 [Tricharina praecox]